MKIKRIIALLLAFSICATSITYKPRQVQAIAIADDAIILASLLAFCGYVYVGNIGDTKTFNEWNTDRKTVLKNIARKLQDIWNEEAERLFNESDKAKIYTFEEWNSGGINTSNNNMPEYPKWDKFKEWLTTHGNVSVAYKYGGLIACVCDRLIPYMLGQSYRDAQIKGNTPTNIYGSEIKDLVDRVITPQELAMCNYQRILYCVNTGEDDYWIDHYNSGSKSTLDTSSIDTLSDRKRTAFALGTQCICESGKITVSNDYYYELVNDKFVQKWDYYWYQIQYDADNVSLLNTNYYAPSYFKRSSNIHDIVDKTPTIVRNVTFLDIDTYTYAEDQVKKAVDTEINDREEDEFDETTDNEAYQLNQITTVSNNIQKRINNGTVTQPIGDPIDPDTVENPDTDTSEGQQENPSQNPSEGQQENPSQNPSEGQQENPSQNPSEGQQENPSTDTSINVPDFVLPSFLKEKFPFCVPWDMYLVIKSMNTNVKIPVFTIPFKWRNGSENITINIDTICKTTILSTNLTFIEVFRSMQIIAYLVILLWLSFKLWR